jgi:RimJ/RimL family protein N-acetyltransferase
MTLREIRKEDLLLILQWRNHPAVRSCMFSQEEIAYEDHQAWFEREKKKKIRNGSYFWEMRIPHWA